MRIRIKFAKYDTMRYIGHLDLMRYVNRLFRRSGLPIKYTEGYHPHQILSFAQPLGLGLTSDGEYMDTELEYEMPLDEIKDKLESAVSKGFSVIGVTRLSDREVNKKLVTAMSLITRSSYLMLLKDNNTAEKVNEEELFGKLKSWLEQPKIIVTKKSKKSEREIELGQYIYEVYRAGKDSAEKIFVNPDCDPVITEELIKNGSLHAPEFDNGIRLAVSLSAGSETNIAPDFFLQCFFEQNGLPLTPSDFRIHRLEFYGGNMKGSLPLCQIP